MASIQKRPEGQWRARYRDENGKEHARHFARKIDAQKWLDEVTASIVTGSYVDPRAGRVTLQSFFDEWSTRQIWTHGTARAMVLSVKCTTFADVELGKILPSHIETWVKKLDSDGLAANTVRTRFNNVRSIFRGAIRDRLISSDPSLNVRLPRARKAEHAMRIPTPEEVGRIMAAADPWLRPLIGLCAFAGLRLGEASAVQLGDIDFLRRTLQVARQVQRPIGLPPEIRAPKYGSERLVHLPEALVTMLAKHVEHFGVGGESQWIFPRSDNLPAHANTISEWWRAIMKAEDLVGLRLHDCRHFYASGLIASGCDVVTVQRAMGHATASTTLNTYSHLWPTAEDRTRQAAQALMKQAFLTDEEFQRAN
ncbi:site-specific integrase [Arthrobacter agilis]|uniref:Site-specific integrase n=1 Tax=Arthrobacter agilis TaxID=37921 RepID=A0A2L0UGZ1_9MICC|nr:site-specific integrase [Arthrobacter agilis]AUZ88521.1 site-specific integrase [Arthrobacter agilis]